MASNTNVSDVSDVGAAKHALRQRILAARDRRSPSDRAAAAAGLAEHGSALLRDVTRIAAYAATAAEPSLDLLLDQWRASVQILLPIIDRDGLDWALDADAAQRRSGQLGIAEPTSSRLGADAIASAAIIFVPAVAVDRQGNRLGRGRGFYDRALIRLRTPAFDQSGNRPRIVACVFDDEVVDGLPSEDHDVTVDAVLTPTGVIVI